MHAWMPWRRHGPTLTNSTWEDDRFLHWAAGRVAVPREAPADSFVLHAPLELMARAVLLGLVPAELHHSARLRIAWLVDRFEAAGDPVEAPDRIDPPDAAHAARDLASALLESDLTGVDRQAFWLGTHASAGDLRRLLGPTVAPALGAAAHAPIGLHLLGRSPWIDGSVLRGCLRELARNPEWRVDVDGLAGGDRPLVEALLEGPLLGPAGSDFIQPMVAHGAAAAAELLADVSPDAGAAGRAVSRVAAWSMLQERDDHVPYGWTHALTIPQAVLSIGLDPATAVAVAGTEVIGLRASMGSRVLDPAAVVPPTAPGVFDDLVAWAALHHDTHVVKYMVACLDAADCRPRRRPAVRGGGDPVGRLVVGRGGRRVLQARDPGPGSPGTGREVVRVGDQQLVAGGCRQGRSHLGDVLVEGARRGWRRRGRRRRRIPGRPDAGRGPGRGRGRAAAPARRWPGRCGPPGRRTGPRSSPAWSIVPSRCSRTASTSSAAVGRPNGGVTSADRRRPTGGRPSGDASPRSPTRSHSLSQTRRPMVASSTERLVPPRWTEACRTQITAHLTVA